VFLLFLLTLNLTLRNEYAKIAQFFSLGVQEMKIILSHATSGLILEKMSPYFENFL
jgi:hypothetical protein